MEGMIAAGLKWLDEHEGADPQFERVLPDLGFLQMYGTILAPANEDGIGLSNAIIAVAPPRCLRDVYEEAISRILQDYKRETEVA